MVQLHRTAADPVPVNGDDIDDWHDYHIQGADTACSHFYGTTDPSSGASWGADQLGYIWTDSNNALGAGDGLGVVTRRWEITAAGPTYGWREIAGARVYIPLEPNVNGLTLADQSTTAFTDLDLQAETSVKAVAALLMVEVEDSGTPASGVYASVRKNGTTTDDRTRRVHPQVADIPATGMYVVELDATQKCEYDINASGAGTFDLRITVLGYYERA